MSADKAPLYTEFYCDLFKDKRGSVKKVLEMRVGCSENMNDYPGYKTGASLYMWQDFFPKAKIYGAGILPKLVFKEGRIGIFQCDQTIKKDLVSLIKKTGRDIDLFINDGSHVPENQAFTCLTVMPMLKKDVVYIIEDVGRAGIIESFGHYDCEVVKSEKGVSRDDRLIVIKNKHG